MRSILLAEDDDFIRELYRIQFTKSGYTIDCAVDGKQALEKVFTGTYDVLLLDIMMPNMDGVEALTEIRAMERLNNFPETPVIMLTNLGEESILNHCKQLGIKGYILKARFIPAEVVAQVEKLLSAA